MTGHLSGLAWSWVVSSPSWLRWSWLLRSLGTRCVTPHPHPNLHRLRRLSRRPRTHHRRVVTLGADNDGHVALWDWREGVNLARHFCGHDVSSGRLRSVAFNADGDSFVTAGAAHLKVWRVGSNSTRSGPHSHHDESKFHAKYRRLGGKSDGKVFGLVDPKAV